MRVVAIIQARVGSTRLPGKVLMDLGGDTMLARCVGRTCRAQTLDEVVVATTVQSSDEVIVDLCIARGWPYFVGSEEDVLDRYYRAAVEYQADVVVRITSDCPLIEPVIIDQTVRKFLSHQPMIDYVSNIYPYRTFPKGLDVEVMRLDALERAWREDVNLAWREHVTQYIQRTPDLFRTLTVVNAVDYSHLRWTVDTPEDLVFVRRVYGHFGSDNFSWQEVLNDASTISAA